MRGSSLAAWAGACGLTGDALVAMIDAGTVPAEIALELRERVGADVRRAA